MPKKFIKTTLTIILYGIKIYSFRGVLVKINEKKYNTFS